MRFSDPEAGPTPWSETARILDEAELYWLTRADGRPHVTPLIGAAHDGAMHFCTGLREQKAYNLEHNQHVAMTTGNNGWAKGLDAVFRIEPDKVFAFAKEPHGQTSYRFTDR